MTPRPRAASILALLATSALAACGPSDSTDASVCRGIQWCTGEPIASPVNVYVLRGDTVRFVACNDILSCGYSGDRGDVPSKWTVPADWIVEILSGDSTPTVVASATGVLLRAVAPGAANVDAIFLRTGAAWTGKVTVADSSAIANIVLRAKTADVLRWQGSKYFDVWLKDNAGNQYRARPTALSVSDSSVLRVKFDGSNFDHSTRLSVYGFAAGTATLRVDFLGVSKTLSVIVAP